MREFLKSIGVLAFGVLRRFLVWLPFLVLDLADVYERYIIPHFPSSWLQRVSAWPDPMPYLVVGAFLLAVGLSFHEMRMAYLAIACAPPRLSHWKEVKVFAVWEAAYLFTEREPIPPPNSVHSDARAYRYWDELQKLHQANAFKKAYPEGGKVFVSREDLLRYAESIDERPKFLFEDW